jgi:hypothetical protein
MPLSTNGIYKSKSDKPGIPAGRKPKAPRPKKKLKSTAKEFQMPERK